jgi:hypothetical protein
MEVLHIRGKQTLSAVKSEVADKMNCQETYESKAGYSHHQLFTDGTAQSIYEPIHLFLRGSDIPSIIYSS